ncbi:hypothetical protein OS190_12825 [Sulfitobacter sp. F26204]|uniref:hypothetical protein n=1 Tax=Sulfitobacter sp. F26204 TaxID=2996014 RepID=UPI00225E0036|nr:hypothetical protein [Sulfitobacter sp. F26204]MCX7560453.1 hypothetical protein [Sulfitobacter sp. F26204]
MPVKWVAPGRACSAKTLSTRSSATLNAPTIEAQVIGNLRQYDSLSPMMYPIEELIALVPKTPLVVPN